MVLICWGVIYERRQGMLRIEYRYKCPTVVRGRQSSPTTLDLESNSPQRRLASCPGRSYRPKPDLWQGTWPDHLLWGWLTVAWVRLLKHVEYRCCCSCDLFIEQVNSHESTWWLREQQQTTNNGQQTPYTSISVGLKPKMKWDDASSVKTCQYFWIHGHNHHGGFRD